jgi:ribosomal protein S18 acetylase RimI-like enzyme
MAMEQQEVIVEPMGVDFALWRCLHSGPLTRDSVDQWNAGDKMPWEKLRARNVPLLHKLAQVYGAYAIVARDGERIIGQLRFYPKAVCEMGEAGQLCLQQAYPAGPRAELVERDFPSLERLEDKTLVVHCMMVGSPSQHENPYLRRGLGTRLARHLIQWAREREWKAIEATAYENLDLVYRVTGSTGVHFWERLGFREAASAIQPELAKENEFVWAIRREAMEKGIDPERIKYEHTMRLEIA